MSNIIVLPQIVPPTELEIRDWHGQRVVTLADIDRLHRRPEGTARKRFNDNRVHFIEGEDYFELDQASEIRRLGLERPQGGTPEKLILMTESGYLMIVKSLTDNLAWQVQRGLVNAYFRVKSSASPIKPATTLKYLAETIRATKKAMPPQADIWPLVRAAYQAAGIEVPEILPTVTPQVLLEKPQPGSLPDLFVQFLKECWAMHGQMKQGTVPIDVNHTQNEVRMAAVPMLAAWDLWCRDHNVPRLGAQTLEIELQRIPGLVVALKKSTRINQKGYRCYVLNIAVLAEKYEIDEDFWKGLS